MASTLNGGGRSPGDLLRSAATAMAIVAVLAASSAGRANARDTVAMSGATMGTTFHVKYVVEEAPVDQGRIRDAMDRAFEEVNRQMSNYRDDSEVSRFNRAPAGEWFPVSAPTARIGAVAQEISRATDGALDVTVGPLVKLWHFGPPPADEKRGAVELVPPAPEEIEAARHVVGWEKFHVRQDPPAFKKEVDGLAVDLSTIAGGYVVDRIAEVLDEHGLANYMVEVGGEVRTRGRRADGNPWRIAIERPARNRRELYAAVELRDAALTTSGDYRNYFEFEGRRYSHIIDPKTGWPIERELGSVSVVADTCLMADAWDTALLILGPEKGLACAEKHGVAALFLPAAPGQPARASRDWKKQFPTP